jgi:hypothetical protein
MKCVTGAPAGKHPERAIVSWNAVEVMERVAHDTDGPEPDERLAERWLVEHEAAITEAMEYAAMDYIREHWKENE